MMGKKPAITVVENAELAQSYRAHAKAGRLIVRGRLTKTPV
jgi:hypothetical protein